jgi:hypothetical protein
VYAPQLISCVVKGDELQIWWISDSRIDTDKMDLDFAIFDGATFKGEPNGKLRSKDVAMYSSPKMECIIGYGSRMVHSILLKDLGIESPENLIIEARISYPGQANPEYKRIQKIVPTSNLDIVPYKATYSTYDPKSRSKREYSTILYKRLIRD